MVVAKMKKITDITEKYRHIRVLYDKECKVVRLTHSELNAIVMFLSSQYRGDKILKIRILLFVTVFLMSPATLLHIKGYSGIREALSKGFKLSKKMVSYYLKDLLFHYEQYRGFREESNRLIAIATNKYPLLLENNEGV